MSCRVLFVCMGNICRSPLGEGIFRSLIEEEGLTAEFEVDSAGTGAWHEGEAPDPRSVEVALRHGIDLSEQRARPVIEEDAERFDWILAMDRENLCQLHARFGSREGLELRLLRDFDPLPGDEVPDPYYAGADGFEEVYRMIQRSCCGLLDRLRA